MPAITEILLPRTRLRRRGMPAYGPDPRGERLKVRITLLGPGGELMDITDRAVDRLGSIEERVEELRTQLVHSDLDLEVDDYDGQIEALLTGVQPTDVWELVIEREVIERSRRRTRRIFAGQLDLPQAVQYDRKEKIVSLQVFGFSALLANASAETVRRTIGTLTGSVTAATNTVTVAPNTTDLRVGDQIQLSNGVFEEDQVVSEVTSATQIKTVKNWGSTFATSTLTVLTPYYRNKGIQFLAEALFDAAGVVDRDVQLDSDLASFPVATPMNRDGLPATAPEDILDKAGYISMTFGTGNRKQTTGPREGFADGAASNNARGDWRPYLATEPGTFPEHGTLLDIWRMGLNPDSDPLDNAVAWNHGGNHDYHVLRTAVVTPSPLSRVRYFRDGSFVVLLDEVADEQGYENLSIEYEPSAGRVWVSYDGSPAGGRTGTWTIRESDGLDEQAVSGVGNGRLRYIQGLGRMAHLSGAGYPPSILRLIDPATGTITSTHDLTAVLAGDTLDHWTLRIFGSNILALAYGGARTRLMIFDFGFDLVAAYVVAASAASPRFLTVWTDTASSVDYGIGYAGGLYFVIGNGYAGIVPYADFEGMSCAAALQELATISAATASVDLYKTGRLWARGYQRPTVAADLPEPIEQETFPVTEFYVGSVEATGKTEDGQDIAVLVGDPGDSARRLTVESNLITTEAIAMAVAQAQFAFYGRAVSQENGTFPLDPIPVPALAEVTLSGRSYLVMESSVHLQDSEQDLVLLELP